MIEQPPQRQLRYTRNVVLGFLNRLVPIINRGVEPTSWYRDSSHNRSVGGNADSQHLLGFAVDLAGSRSQLQALARAARSAGLTAVDEGDHVHVQAFPAGVIRGRGYGWLYDL